MSLKIKVAGVNAFLETIYGPHSRPSTLLQALGCTSEQVMLLRTRSLEAFIDGFVQCIAERLAQYGGERRYRVLARRLGLDGENPAPLGELGVELGVSRERVRQIQEGTVQRCRSRKQCYYWLEALYSCAADFLIGEEIALCPFDPERATPLIERAMPSAARVPMPATPTELGGPAIDPSPDVRQETVDRLNDTINAIFAIAGDDIADSILTDLLLGSARPVIAALVGHYSLQFSHGAFADIDRKRLKTLIRDVRRADRRLPPMTVGHVDVACASVDDPERVEVVSLVADIRACIGRYLSSTMCAHILHGSHGLRVDALVQEYRPPHYGRLRPLGIKRVQELTKGAYARAQYNQSRTNQEGLRDHGNH